MSMPMQYSKQFAGKQATKALDQALKIGGMTRTGAYKTLIKIWEVQIARALDGDIDAAKMIVDRIEGKAAAKIDVAVEFSDDVLMALDAGRKRVADARIAEQQAIDSTSEDITDAEIVSDDDDA